MLKAFRNVLNTLHHLCFSASLFDFFSCALGELCSLYSQLSCQLAVAEHLDTIACLLDQTSSDEQFCINNGTFCELIQVRNVYNGIFLCENVVETSLRNTSSQGHLAAFETDSYAAAATCILALMALACGLAVTGTVATANSLNFLGGAFCRGQFVKLHNVHLLR